MTLSGDKPAVKLKSLHVCRGIAALLVTLLHLGALISSPPYFNEPLFQWISTKSDLRVCFFFVLSGFLLTLAHAHDFGKPSAWPSYLLNWAIRIYPMYWLLLFGLYGAYTLVPGWQHNLPEDAWLLFKAVALLPQNTNSFLRATWTLPLLIIFYLYFGLIILNRMIAVAVAINVLILLMLEYYMHWHYLIAVLKYFIIFGAGIMTALAIRAEVWDSGARPACLIGAGLFVASIIVDQINIRSVIHGLAACFIIFGLAKIEQKKSIEVWKGWLLLGDSSYVLYIIHFPIQIVICKCAIAVGLAGIAGSAIAWATSLGICLAAAILIHLHIERPMLEASRGLVKRLAPMKPFRGPRPIEACANRGVSPSVPQVEAL